MTPEINVSIDTRYTFVASPVGRVWVAWCDAGLVSVGFEKQSKGAQVDLAWRFDPELECDACDQLEAYFAGALRDFDLPLVLGGTVFQRRVWQELASIPFGETTTYGALADRLGRPGASRAVGAANGRNPIAIVLPCHRVVGQGGRLTGYAGGLEIKQQLLDFEQAVATA